MSDTGPGAVPPERLRVANHAPLRAERDYVLYWMTAARRAHASFALDRAADWAREFGRPLVVLEALRLDYPYASDRFHQFVIDGMRDNARDFAAAGVAYLAYVEPEPGAGKGLLSALASRAAIVIGDDYPASFLPRMVEAAAVGIDVRLEVVDGNGLMPMRVAGQPFATAYAFRRFLQKNLPSYLGFLPQATPLANLRPAHLNLLRSVTARWPSADHGTLARLPIDHGVRAGALRGGSVAARRRLAQFVAKSLPRYELRNHPDEEVASGLSPYLHWGHIGAHEIFAAIASRESWSDGRIARSSSGKRTGWWGMSPEAEAFLDQLVTWRELGFNACVHERDLTTVDALPPWARATLKKHTADQRPWLYSLDQLAKGETHDGVWNAAQYELRERGTMHNYLRMLWGKNVIQWTRSPEEALRCLFDLNDRFALDGRDPNSISGITWVLGRYDRPWGPERPVLGTVRYMTTAATLRKLELKHYLQRNRASTRDVALDE